MAAEAAEAPDSKKVEKITNDVTEARGEAAATDSDPTNGAYTAFKKGFDQDFASATTPDARNAVIRDYRAALDAMGPQGLDITAKWLHDTFPSDKRLTDNTAITTVKDLNNGRGGTDAFSQMMAKHAVDHVVDFDRFHLLGSWTASDMVGRVVDGRLADARAHNPLYAQQHADRVAMRDVVPGTNPPRLVPENERLMSTLTDKPRDATGRLTGEPSLREKLATASGTTDGSYTLDGAKRFLKDNPNADPKQRALVEKMVNYWSTEAPAGSPDAAFVHKLRLAQGATLMETPRTGRVHTERGESEYNGKQYEFKGEKYGPVTIDNLAASSGVSRDQVTGGDTRTDVRRPTDRPADRPAAPERPEVAAVAKTYMAAASLSPEERAKYFKFDPNKPFDASATTTQAAMERASKDNTLTVAQRAAFGELAKNWPKDVSKTDPVSLDSLNRTTGLGLDRLTYGTDRQRGMMTQFRADLDRGQFSHFMTDGGFDKATVTQRLGALEPNDPKRQAGERLLGMWDQLARGDANKISAGDLAKFKPPTDRPSAVPAATPEIRAQVAPVVERVVRNNQPVHLDRNTSVTDQTFKRYAEQARLEGKPRPTVDEYRTAMVPAYNEHLKAHGHPPMNEQEVKLWMDKGKLTQRFNSHLHRDFNPFSAERSEANLNRAVDKLVPKTGELMQLNPQQVDYIMKKQTEIRAGKDPNDPANAELYKNSRFGTLAEQFSRSTDPEVKKLFPKEIPAGTGDRIERQQRDIRATLRGVAAEERIKYREAHPTAPERGREQRTPTERARPVEDNTPEGIVRKGYQALPDRYQKMLNGDKPPGQREVTSASLQPVIAAMDADLKNPALTVRQKAEIERGVRAAGAMKQVLEGLDGRATPPGKAVVKLDAAPTAERAVVRPDAARPAEANPLAGLDRITEGNVRSEFGAIASAIQTKNIFRDWNGPLTDKQYGDAINALKSAPSPGNLALAGRMENVQAVLKSKGLWPAALTLLRPPAPRS